MKRSEKLKRIDAETYPQEALVDEEPRYLRRQKPVEIKRRKFGKKAWKNYFRVSLAVIVLALAGGGIFATGSFLLTSPRMALANPSQVELSGNHFVSRASVLEIFAADRGRSVMRIPLAKRRAQVEELPWVERATVRRALPNLIQVNVVERTPVAFLREGANLSLVDGQGQILDRPLEGDFHFPVVTGISAGMPREERGQRMKMMVDFLTGIRQVRAGAEESVSEIDLSDANDLQATLAGLQGAADAVLVHFGNSGFHDKFQVLLNNIGQWEAAAGRVASVDLRFEHEVVVNPENSLPAAAPSHVTAAPAHVAAAPTRVAAAPSHVVAAKPVATARLAGDAKPKLEPVAQRKIVHARRRTAPHAKQRRPEKRRARR
ncbi:MAG TPA: FtsQ-type POTRA domain-containing protein [Candidatus Acidoferrales bacterium]|nr:FtsQ-type POTRA domain-containing protein [Candidatus Acidoferrales bacterium]